MGRHNPNPRLGSPERNPAGPTPVNRMHAPEARRGVRVQVVGDKSFQMGGQTFTPGQVIELPPDTAMALGARVQPAE